MAKTKGLSLRGYERLRATFRVTIFVLYTRGIAFPKQVRERLYLAMTRGEEIRLFQAQKSPAGKPAGLDI